MASASPSRLLQATAVAGALALVPLGTGAMAQSDTESYRAFAPFFQVLSTVRADYVEKVDDKTLVKGAIDGMLAALDPHSAYEDGADYDNLNIQTQGKYGGLGLTVVLDNGAVKVVSAQEDTPAARAGIKSGDFISHVDGKLIVGGSLDEAVGLMRGAPGSKVSLTLIRPGRDLPVTANLIREVIVTKPVKASVKDGVGIIDINTFLNRNTGEAVRAAIAEINVKLGHAPTGYVLDLRENGGGLLDQAVEVADTFMTGGQIVSQRGRNPIDDERYYAETAVKGDLTNGAPLIVLTDPGTASASEIVAGALQDSHRAIVMGERTFGKGSVQTLIPMGPHTALRLTTARYYTPSGRSVQEGGIEPNVYVPQLSDPDYKLRPVIREVDLRRHLVNTAKADPALLVTDSKADPRFSATPEQLKAQGITDFQLDYAVKTLARLGGAPKVAAVRG